MYTYEEMFIYDKNQEASQHQKSRVRLNQLVHDGFALKITTKRIYSLSDYRG